MRIDLHCHTTASDGERTPDELIFAARSARLDVLALTDHDTVQNLDLMRGFCRDAGIFFIPGIELSCWNGRESIHILGYFKGTDYNNEELSSTLEAFQTRRAQRAIEIRDRLRQYFDIVIDLSELDMGPGASVGRANLARLIGEKYGLTKDEVFARYLGDHSRAFIPSSDMAPADGIALLQKSGALAVMAHPGALKKTKFDDLFQLAFDGAECYYPSHSKRQTDELISACIRRERYISCGSDDHGILGDTKHGTLGSVPFQEKHLMPLLRELGYPLE